MRRTNDAADDMPAQAGGNAKKVLIMALAGLTMIGATAGATAIIVILT